MKKARKGDAVKVHYTGKFEDGSVFDSSREREPMQFTLGKGDLIKGFEEAVLGTSVGETRTISIPPDKGYGLHREELVFRVEKEKFPSAIEPAIGAKLQMRQPDGGVLEVRISRVTEDTVVLDANHPLAGKDLVFEIEVVEIF